MNNMKLKVNKLIERPVWIIENIDYKSDLLKLILASLVAITFLFPLYWLFRISVIWPPEGLIGNPPSLILNELSSYNFFRIYAEVNLVRYTLNSAIVSFISILSQLLFGSLAAYGLTFDFKGKKIVFIIMVTGMLVPFQTIFLTDYLIASYLGLSDTYIGLAIVVSLSVVNVLVLYATFNSIPKSLYEAAKVDGASELYILFGIFWPLSKPALATVTILSGVFSWNQYLWPLLIVGSDNMSTLPLSLAVFQSAFGSNFALQYAFAALSIGPILLLFLLTQNRFIKSATTNAIKQ
jgi:multiple sugar transport system permease protein